MIQTELTAGTARATGTDTTGTSSSSAPAGDIQLVDLEENSFGEALTSHIDQLSETEQILTSGDSILASGILDDGKELPLLPLSGPSADTESLMLEQSELTILLDEEPDPILSGSPFVLPGHIEKKTPGEPLPAISRQKLQKTQLQVEDTTRVLKTRELMSTAEESIATRTNVAASNVDLKNLNVTSTERTSDPFMLSNPGTLSRPSGPDSVSNLSNPLKLSIGVPVQQANWGDNLAGRVSYMLMNNQQTAQIKLNPAELGPIEVKVSLQNDQANINFYAHNATVREAIEEAFPKLRDMLNENGLNLSQSSVSDQSLSEKQGQNEASSLDQAQYPFIDETETTDNHLNEVVKVKIGLVDHFV